VTPSKAAALTELLALLEVSGQTKPSGASGVHGGRRVIKQGSGSGAKWVAQDVRPTPSPGTPKAKAGFNVSAADHLNPK